MRSQHLKRCAKGKCGGQVSEGRKGEFAVRIKSFEDKHNATVNDRNAVAHGQNITMSHGGFKRNSDAAGSVFVELETLLDMDRSEIEGEWAARAERQTARARPAGRPRMQESARPEQSGPQRMQASTSPPPPPRGRVKAEPAKAPGVGSLGCRIRAPGAT